MPNLFPLDAAIAMVEVERPREAKLGAAGPTTGKPSFNFLTRWNALTDRIEQAPYSPFAPTRLTDQNASIGATPLAQAALPAGLYRVSWYARVTTAAGVSSSLTVTIGWTEGSVALSLSGAALTGNLVTSVQSGMVFLLIDDGSPITYATTYASNAAGAMKYTLVLNLERVQ